MKKYLPFLANIGAQILFGFGYLFTRLGMEVIDNDSVKLLAYRFCIGFLVLSLLVLFGFKKVDYSTGPIGLILLCGLFNPLISQVLEVTSTSYAPTSQIHMYNSVLPIVMILFSAVINREYPTKKQFVFVCITVLGVFITRLADAEESGMTTLGMILIVATIIVVSINRALVRRATGRFGSFEIVYLTTLMGAVGFSLYSVGGHVMHDPLVTYFEPLLHTNFVISILYLGIGSACCAFLLMTYASANLPYAVYSSTCTVSTIVGILAGVLILKETFQIQQMIGTVVILIGVIGVSFTYDKDDPNGNRFLKKEADK